MRCNRKKDDIVSRLPYWFNILCIKAFQECPFQVRSRVSSSIVVTVQRGFNLVIWFTANYRSEWNNSKYEGDPLSAHQWFPVVCWQMRKSLVPSLVGGFWMRGIVVVWLEDCLSTVGQIKEEPDMVLQHILVQPLQTTYFTILYKTKVI